MSVPEIIRVWLLRLPESWQAADREQLVRWRSWLAADEIARADAFVTEKLRHDFTAAHAATRFVLGGCLGIKPEAVAYVAGGTGEKPEISGNFIKLNNLRFNLSHTAGAVLVAVAGFEIGVDIEWRRPVDDLKSMVRAVMSEAELARWKELKAIAPHASHLQERIFYNLWTRKEAYLKAIGLGLYRSLQDVTVPVSILPLTEPQRVEDLSGTEVVWSVQDIILPGLLDECSASICWPGNAPIGIEVSEIDLQAL